MLVNRKKIIQFSVLSFCLFVPIFSVLGQQDAEEIQVIRLHVGSVKAMDVGEIVRIAIARDEILGSTVLENGQLLLIPKAAGETDLQIWKPGERTLVYRISILQENILAKESLVKSLVSAYPEVELRSSDNFIILEGTIPPEEEERFKALVSIVPNVISLVRTKAFLPRQMIKIRLQVLEVDKRFKKELGIKWGQSMSGPIIGIASALVQNDVYGIVPDDGFDWEDALSGVGLDEPFFYPFIGFTGTLASRIELLEENGTGRTLAEPTLVTRSGEPARFHSGGEFPIVFSQLGEARVTFKEYGIIFDILPVVDDLDNILVNISSEVSTIDFASAVNGVPGLLTRNTDSVINVKSGETIVISGLISVFESNNLTKVPILGDLPLLGKLFRSKGTQESRNELLVLVTPEIVLPDGSNNLPSALMSRHLDELHGVQQGYIDDELLD